MTPQGMGCNAWIGKASKERIFHTMATVTKREIVIDLSNQTGIKQQEVATLVDAFIDLLGKRLEEGHNIAFRTFGTFDLRVAKSKIGRNPNRPDHEVRIPDRCVVRFKPGRELKARVAELPPEKLRES